MRIAAIAALLLAEAVFAAPSNEKRQLGAICSYLPGVVGCICKNGDHAIMGSTGSAFKIPGMPEFDS